MATEIRPDQDQEPQRRTFRNLRQWGTGYLVKLLALAIMNGFVVVAIPFLWGDSQWLLLAALVVGAIGINIVFLIEAAMPLRWLVPGVIFLALMLVYPLFYTIYVSLTNWSTGHVLTKPQAIEQTLRETFLPEEPQRFTLAYYGDDAGELRVLLVDESGNQYFGEPRLESEPVVDDASQDPADLETVDSDGDGTPETIDGFDRLNLAAILQIPNIDDLAFDTPVGQAILEANRASLKEFRYSYDEARDVLIDNQLQLECPADGTIGNFVCGDPETGELAGIGWRVVIGFENFTSIATDERVRGPFTRVISWNIIYAVLSVGTQFGLGLLLALSFQKEKLRGKALYRTLLIIPWAMPGFISIIIWRGLLQGTDFGPANQLIGLFGFEAISWLNDPFWARVSIILVNLWLGFPYMFLVISGALQAIPSDVQEAARTDGASGPQIFRKVTMPLLFISTAPLLIASFAFNFNNFINIFLLTRGGPPLVGYDLPVGETDILISFTYNLAISTGRGQNFGLASAFTFFIFLIVVAISAFSFRFTRRLEQIYGGE
ncbi:MAG: ABC transporter permease subunit [Acidimicrobiia bacterium]|nr:ABC transporter permease subunit [Acidimicrobiia bacterium]